MVTAPGHGDWGTHSEPLTSIKPSAASITTDGIRTPPAKPMHSYSHQSGKLRMGTAYELHRQQLIKAYNNAVKRKDWQSAKNFRDELNILIARKVELS